MQEIDSEGYWKIFVSDLGDRKMLDTFGRNYAQRVLTMDTTQLSFLASLSFTEFAHLVTIHREEEHKNDGDAPGYNVCVQRLCAEEYDRPIFEAARRQLEWVDLNPNWNSQGDCKQAITPVEWQAFLDMARQTLLVGICCHMHSVAGHLQKAWGSRTRPDCTVRCENSARRCLQKNTSGISSHSSRLTSGTCLGSTLVRSQTPYSQSKSALTN